MYQKITIVGNIGKDFELKHTPKNVAFAKFSVGTSNKKDTTTWFNVTVWDEQAKSCATYLGKGSLVLCEGYLEADDKGNPRIWNDKEGQPRANFEMTALTVKFFPKKETSASTNGDEIPF